MHRRQALHALATLPALPGSRWRKAAGPIKLWVGVTPGGSTDTIAREIAPEMGRLLGRTVIVENRSGAGGNLAADGVAKSAPDGSNLLVSFTSHTINASLYKKLPFDPVADFTPLTMLTTSTSVLVCHPEQPYKTVAELIAYAKTRPGQLSMGLGGIGSSVHLAGEAFKLQAKVYIVNIPYRGTAPAVADVVAGNLPLDVLAAAQHTRPDPGRQAAPAGCHQPEAAAGVPRLAGDCRDAAGLPVAGLVRPVRAGAHGAGPGQAHQRRGAHGRAKRQHPPAAGR
jgi:tripartite-type tricarboxylate transporter receptor subunit TctC